MAGWRDTVGPVSQHWSAGSADHLVATHRRLLRQTRTPLPPDELVGCPPFSSCLVPFQVYFVDFPLLRQTLERCLFFPHTGSLNNVLDLHSDVRPHFQSLGPSPCKPALSWPFTDLGAWMPHFFQWLFLLCKQFLLSFIPQTKQSRIIFSRVALNWQYSAKRRSSAM
jgi:hypothetical protein